MLASLPYFVDAQKVMTLKAYDKNHATDATNVFGHSCFKSEDAGKGSLVATKKLAALIKDPCLQRLVRIELAEFVLLLWAFEFDKSSKSIKPTGLALVNPSQWSLKAGASEILSK